MKAVKTRFTQPYKENKNGKLVTNLPFLDSTKKQSGVYLIKSNRTGKIVYVGYSIGTLYRTIFRHFQKWTDIQRIKKTRFTYSKTGYTVRVILTTPLRAGLLEKHLIMQMQPRDNQIKYDSYLSASQQTTCENLLNNAPIINQHEEHPF